MSAETVLSPQSPWPGLRAFQETDRSFFFGRERETAELVTLIQRSTVVVLYGQSGLGKTSLLQAGVFHPIRENGLLPFRVRLDHGESSPSLADQIKTELTAALNAASITGPRPDPAESLWAYFHRRDVELWGPRNRLFKPVIVLDQFEELFTLGQRSDRAAKRVADFAQELESLLEHRAPDAVRAALEARPDDGLRYDFQRDAVKLIITLREDFLAQLDTWRTRMPSLLPNRFRLERMTGAQALDAVQCAGPALVDATVAQQIVDFVSRSQRRTQIGALQQRNVEPALLSVVCDELNRRRLDRHQSRITTDLLTGEREGIIQAFYNRAFEDVDSRTRDWIEDQLLTGSGYRDRAALEDAVRAGVRESDIDRLVDRRLVHREERDGVVWLELTHDLLTDPAFASRTERAQRHLAEEASRREAETAQRLRRARRLTGVFGVLLAATVVALFFAFRNSARANQARDRALAAETSASASAGRERASAEEAQKEADRATRSFDTAMRMAEPLGQSLRDFVHGDMRLLTSAVLEVIGRSDDSYQSLAAQNATATADQRAEFLTTASEALYQVGHLTDAVGRAEQAVELLGRADAAEAPARRRVRAEALFARAIGFGASGRMSDARRDYNEVMSLAQADARASAWTMDLVRLKVLSELGLGELDRWSLAGPSAEAHYLAVGTFLNAHPLPKSDATYDAWRVTATMGLAANVNEAAKADGYYARANTLLRRLLAANPDSLRLEKLNAELQFLRGDIALKLGRTWAAVKLFQEGDDTATRLSQSDRDNLQWKLLWIRTQRGTGDGERSRQLFTLAQKTFDAAERAAVELLSAEPSWRMARYVHAALLWELGDTFDEQKDNARAAPYMQKSRDEFAIGAKRAPGDLEFIRAVAIAIRGLANTAHTNDDALRFIQQAMDALAPLERGPKTDPLVLRNKADYLGLAGHSWADKNNWKEANRAHASQVATLEAAAAQTKLPSDYESLSYALVDLGRTQKTLGDAAAALSSYQRALEAASKSLAGDPSDNDAVQADIIARLAIEDERLEQKNFSAAFDQIRSASDVVWSHLRNVPWHPTLQSDMVVLANRINLLETAIKNAGSTASQTDLITRMHALVAERPISSLTNWATRPLMPGAWSNVPAAELDPYRKLVSQAYPKIKPEQVFAVRALPLEFRKDRDVLYEAGIEDDNGERGVAAFVRKQTFAADSGPFAVLDGSSPPVHAMNSESPPLLDTVEHATAYFRFFTGMLHADLGPFSVVEKPEDILWRPDAPSGLRAQINKELEPVRLAKQPDGSWKATCTWIYGAVLFSEQLTISPKAAIEVTNETALSNPLPVFVESLTDGVKTLKSPDDLKEQTLAKDRKKLEATPTDRDLLRNVVSLSVELAHWKEAASAEQRLLDELKNDLKTKSEWPGAYMALGIYQLLARDFAGALKSADEGRPFGTNTLAFEALRAHALLFLGRIRDAEPIYRAHIGQKLREGSDVTWEQSALDDFDLFERNGLTHPDVARIRKLLKPGLGNRSQLTKNN